MQSQGHIVVQQTIPRRANPRQEIGNWLRRIGIAEVLIGIITIILSITLLSIVTSKGHSSTGDRIGIGIWSGAVILVTGILAIAIRPDSRRCMFVCSLIMAIVSTVVGSVAMLASVIAILGSFSWIFHVITIALCFIGVIVSVVHAIRGCGGVYDGRYEPAQPAYAPTQSVVLVQSLVQQPQIPSVHILGENEAFDLEDNPPDYTDLQYEPQEELGTAAEDDYANMMDEPPEYTP